ncbi:MAG: alpha/beta fold hydrolase [Synechococcales cyanobacterium]
MGPLELSNTPLDRAGSRRPACLLLHGLGAGVFEMCLLAEVLHQQGYPVRAFNYPGHDQPGSVMPHSTWEQWYGAVESHYQDLAQRYGQVAVIGFSTGGTLGLRLAAHHAVGPLVLLAPFLRLKTPSFLPIPLEDIVNSPLGVLISSVPRQGSPIAEPQMQRLATQVRPYQTFSVLSVRSAVALTRWVEHNLARVTTPTLIVQSPIDSVVDPQGAQIIHDRLGSPRRELLWLKQSDHIITLDWEREQVFAAVLDFLAETNPSHPGVLG